MAHSTKINNPLPDNQFFDEALLGYADGHCLFDADQKLLSWSENFVDLYPAVKSKIVKGLVYRDWLRLLVTGKAIKNPPVIDDLQSWIEEQATIALDQNTSSVHHLQDDRRILIKHVILSTGHSFYAAKDITESYLARQDLKIAADKFSRFAELASDWFWELDADLKYKYHSEHVARHADAATPRSLAGMSRLDDLKRTGVVQNEQLLEHNRCLLNREAVDVVLTLEHSMGNKTFAQVLAEPLYDKDGSYTGYIGCGRDVTAMFEMQQEISFYASRDRLTGLLNRRSLMEVVQQRLDDLRRGATATPSQHTVVMFDIDHFKVLNDEAGHNVGDRILKQFAAFLEERIPADSILARLGGDEFAALIPRSSDELMQPLQQLIDEVCLHPFVLEQSSFQLSMSAGLADLLTEHTSPIEILRCADIACYSAKEAGRADLNIYSSDNQFQAKQDAEIRYLKIAQSAIKNEDFALYLQPIVMASDRSCVNKLEVLVRFFDNENVMVSPAEVISVAEKFDLMQALDAQIVSRSLEWINQFKQAGIELSLSVNLSGATLGNERYLEKISNILIEFDAEGGQLESLCLEITETTAIRNVDTVQRFIQRFRAKGCRFSLDDFGSGLASFAYLKVIAADYLKIDGSFISNILIDSTNQAIVNSFNTLAHELGMQTVAEFVESDEIANYLQNHRIDYLQGYGIGKPESADIWFERLLGNSEHLWRKAG